MENRVDINGILDDISKLAKCNSDKELAGFLNMKTSALSCVRKRKVKNQRKLEKYLRIRESLEKGEIDVTVKPQINDLSALRLRCSAVEARLSVLENEFQAFNEARADLVLARRLAGKWGVETESTQPAQGATGQNTGGPL